VNQIPGSDSYAVVYPATLQNYQSSESQGVSAMTSDIEDYVKACPNSKIVLMGYSQVSFRSLGWGYGLMSICG
jgi:acetylxylan esterase